MDRGVKMDDVTKKFVKEVNAKMKRMDKTQKALSEEIDYDKTTLSRVLRYRRKLDFNVAVSIADNLNIDLEKFKSRNIGAETKDELINQMEALLIKFKELP